MVALAIVGGTTYYNIIQPSPLEIRTEAVLALVQQHGMNPMIFECMERSWTSVSDFEICKIVAGDPFISKEKLAARLSAGDD